MKREKAGSEQISISLPTDLKVEIDARAEILGLPRSRVIALAVEAHLREERVIEALLQGIAASAAGLTHGLGTGPGSDLQSMIEAGFERIETGLQEQKIVLTGLRDAARKSPDLVLEGVTRHVDRLEEKIISMADEQASLAKKIGDVWSSMPRVTSALASLLDKFGLSVDSGKAKP
jgi:predicted transcriptional regulator